jgi:hypothetical protein
LLLRAGADPLALDSDHWDAVQIASSKGHYAIAHMVLQHQNEHQHQHLRQLLPEHTASTARN